MPPLSNLQNRANRLPMISLLLMEVQGTGQSPSLAPLNWVEPDGAGRSESNEGDPAPRALQVIPPSDRGEEQPSKSKYMRSGMPKLNRPNQVITHNYHPPRRPKPLRVEISAPGMEEVKDILRCWEPFHRKASAADRLDNLYLHIYRVLVAARGMGLREDYSVTLHASTPKEDFLQIIDDGIQVRNRNFIQSTELVREAVPPGDFSAIAYFLSC